MKKNIIFVAILFALIFPIENSFADSIKEKSNIIIKDTAISFQYDFPKKPKLGEKNILRVKLNAPKEQFKNLKVFVSSDMPSMRGHHTTQPTEMKKNLKNDFLLPLDFVMRGEWEVVLSIQDNGKEIYSGTILLDL